MAENGWGYFKIAKTLQAQGVPNPRSYAEGTHDTRWHLTSVQVILQNPVYCGDLAQCRRGNRTMHGKQEHKPADQWIVVENTHEPLVSRAQWDAVQKTLASRKRSMKNGEVQMFAGLLYCADCGSALPFSVRHRITMPDTGTFKCWRYMRYGKTECSSHYITLDQLTQVVLEDIRRHARYAKYHREDFMRLLMEEQKLRDETEATRQKEQSEQAKKRLAQVDGIIRKLLEQNAAGVISDERFATMVKEYETEQEGLKATIQVCEEAMTARTQTVENIQRHIEIVEQYTDLQKLDGRILNRLIEKIVVHQRTVDADGNAVQEVEIFYRFFVCANFFIVALAINCLLVRKENVLYRLSVRSVLHTLGYNHRWKPSGILCPLAYGRFQNR